MTALKEFERLEAAAIWTGGPGEQRRDVIVSIGDATLAIFDGAGRPLAHWSLAAVRRLNGEERPALYAPGPDTDADAETGAETGAETDAETDSETGAETDAVIDERLEIEDDTMIGAIEKVRRVVERNRPRPGRLRHVLLAGALVAITALAVFWLPDAMIRHTVKVVPPAVRADIGASLLGAIERVAGRACAAPGPARILDLLAGRLLPDRKVRLVVLSRGLTAAEHLPGGYILLDRALIESFDGPAAAAGFILAEDQRARILDPLERLLLSTGPLSAFRLLISGRMRDETLDHHAQTLLLRPPEPLAPADLLERFAHARVSASPYARALGSTGEATLALIKGDPVAPGTGRAILNDRDWVTLQEICGEP